jgi:hypothetical protein
MKVRHSQGLSRETIRRKLRADAMQAMFPLGEPITERARTEMFELYKMAVASSEALVARRQGNNTFFLTANGLLVTAIGLFIKSGGDARLHAGAVTLLTLVGLALCYSWGSLLNYFRQLNTGKFVVICEIERRLAVAIYNGEWVALGEGRIGWIYRSFTKREGYVPWAIGIGYLVSAVVGALVWTGLWHIG